MNYKEITSTRFVKPSEILFKNSTTPGPIVTETRAQTATEEHGRSTNVTSRTSNMMKTNEPTTILTSSETSTVNGTERVGQETTLFVSSGATTIGSGKVNTTGIGSTVPFGNMGHDNTTIVVTEAVSETTGISAGTTGPELNLTDINALSTNPNSVTPDSSTIGPFSVKSPTVGLSSPSETVIGPNYTTMSSEQPDNSPTYSSTIETKPLVSSTTTTSSQPIDHSLLTDGSKSDGAVNSGTSEPSSENFFSSYDRSTQSFSKPISELPSTERVTTNYFRISTSRKITGFDYSTTEQQRSATHAESSTTQSHVDLTVTRTKSGSSPAFLVSNKAYKTTTKPTVSITREQLKTPEMASGGAKTYQTFSGTKTETATSGSVHTEPYFETTLSPASELVKDRSDGSSLPIYSSSVSVGSEPTDTIPTTTKYSDTSKTVHLHSPSTTPMPISREFINWIETNKGSNNWPSSYMIPVTTTLKPETTKITKGATASTEVLTSACTSASILSGSGILGPYTPAVALIITILILMIILCSISWCCCAFRRRLEKRRRQISWAENQIPVLRHGFNLTPKSTMMIPVEVNRTSSAATYTLPSVPGSSVNDRSRKYRINKGKLMFDPGATTTAVIPIEPQFLTHQSHSTSEHFTSPTEGGISGNKVEMEQINSRESVGASSFGYAIPINNAFANGIAIKSMDTERVAPYATATTFRIIRPSEPVFASTSQISQPPDYWEKKINGSELLMIDDCEALDDTNDTRDYQVSTFLRQPKS
ncbi:hypothetical protein D915_002029 [Fasciola hepatica]|uniref:Uncharacterized protein n=1 Tax=Fasciola hepatica TaxID=6192 RepID=A0A4E0RII0_FASHE|nr:hypothetical protein D915_002029 [Fasciola hepatica]